MKGLDTAVIAHKKPNAEMLKVSKPVKEKVSKKTSKVKDTEAPKRPLTAFFVFLEDFRKSFKEENPDNKSQALVSKAAGEKWNSMSASEKAPYVEKALERKVEYEKARDVYEKKKLSNEESGNPEDSGKPSSEVHNENEHEASSGLQKYLNQQGSYIVAYDCTTCIGNSGDLDESAASAVADNDIVPEAVLSGNRNFEGQVHASTRANYLASPPRVVAYALASAFDIDFDKEPIGIGKDGKDVYFRDIWPTEEEIAELVQSSAFPEMVRSAYEAITMGNPVWNELTVPGKSSYS